MNYHLPVMFNEVMRVIKPAPNLHILDCTFGRGGHTQGFLGYGAKVIGIDRDPKAVQWGNLNSFSRFQMYHARFSQIADILNQKFNAIFFDFGLSSPQIHDPRFGMSFQVDSPLSMCMGLNHTSAYDFVNFAPEGIIADVIYQYGEEHKSRQIAHQICIARKNKAIETTRELAAIVHKIVPRGKIDPATRTFQAIRIYVNDELTEIRRGLNAAMHLLKNNGIICAITFHSLEDRIVKYFFRQFTRKANMIMPTLEEVRFNARSRSAKLRFYRFRQL